MATAKKQARQAARQERKQTKQAAKAEKVEARRANSARTQRTERKANRQAQRTERQRLRSEAKVGAAQARADGRARIAEATGEAPGAWARDAVGQGLDFVQDAFFPGESGGMPDDYGRGGGGNPEYDEANAGAEGGMSTGTMIAVGAGVVALLGGLAFLTSR